MVTFRNRAALPYARSAIFLVWKDDVTLCNTRDFLKMGSGFDYLDLFWIFVNFTAQIMEQTDSINVADICVVCPDLIQKRPDNKG